MPPKTSRDFQRAAAQRLIAAEVLFEAKLLLDAKYIGGYTIECTLKALILEQTPSPKKAEKLGRITSGAKMHQPDILFDELRKLKVPLPPDLAKRLRQFGWNVDLRYETGRGDTRQTIAFLKMAKAIYEWVEGQLP